MLKQFTFLIPILAALIIILQFVLAGGNLKWATVILGVLILALSYERLLGLFGKKRGGGMPQQQQ